MAAEQTFATRYELCFGDRLVRCYRQRAPSMLASFRAAARRAAQSECLVCGARRFTYRDVEDYVERIAAQLGRRGLEPGERVGLLIGNEAEFVLALLGILRAGAIAVPINVREARAGVDYILGHCEARAVIFDCEYAPKIGDRQVLPALRLRFSIGGASDASEAFDALTASGARAAPEPAIAEQDTAVILYTSGTTGRPKGVRLTHFNLVHSVMHFQSRMALGDGERTLLVVPASHVTGLLASILQMIHVAGCVVIMRAFDAPEFVRLAAAEKITHVLAVPAMYNLCLLRTDLSRHDLSRWRIGGFGGAPMPEVTIAKLHEQLPNLQLINAYGATETTSPVTIMPRGDTARCPDSVGTVVDCGDVRIMDENGCEMAAGEPGELWIGGAMVVPGYWNNPEADAREFVAGYWRSGDIGAVDEHGYVRVFDRKKDMINRGGYNVYSVEVENIVAQHAGVVECAVVARPDPVLGEKIHVFASRDDTGQTLDADSIRQFCAEQLADYKVPDFVTVRDEPLPRNANGKVLKGQLRDCGQAD